MSFGNDINIISVQNIITSMEITPIRTASFQLYISIINDNLHPSNDLFKNTG